MSDDSLLVRELTELIERVGRDEALVRLENALAQLTHDEVIALQYDWGLWARPSQLPPSTEWRRWGQFGGRGFGKTRANAQWVQSEVERLGAVKVGLIAQDADHVVDLMVYGDSGICSVSHPSMRPEYRSSTETLEWPNGAVGYVLSPIGPAADKIRGYNLHLSWATELQSWPVSTRQLAWDNLQFATRLGDSRIVWDCTPSRGHPIILELLSDNEAFPSVYPITRGTMRDNRVNLGDAYIQEIERKYGGTTRGLVEIEGQQPVDDSELVVVPSSVLEQSRGPAPERFLYRGIGLDPAITTSYGSDETGIIEAATDGQRAYVLRDMTGKHRPETWAKLVVDQYLRARCNIIVVETNRGGHLVTSTLRAECAAREVPIELVVLKDDDRLRVHSPRHVWVKEVHARGSKQSRADPIAVAYKSGCVVHPYDSSLVQYEEVITTWEARPGAYSPDRLDAAVHILTELLGLRGKRGGRHAKPNDVNTASALAKLAQHKQQMQAQPSNHLGSLRPVLRGRL